MWCFSEVSEWGEETCWPVWCWNVSQRQTIQLGRGSFDVFLIFSRKSLHKNVFDALVSCTCWVVPVILGPWGHFRHLYIMKTPKRTPQSNLRKRQWNKCLFIWNWVGWTKPEVKVQLMLKHGEPLEFCPEKLLLFSVCTDINYLWSPLYSDFALSLFPWCHMRENEPCESQ